MISAVVLVTSQSKQSFDLKNGPIVKRFHIIQTDHTENDREEPSLMPLDLYQLDSITDFDEAIDRLDNYVADLVDEFVETSEGKAYLKAHPDMEEFVGSWIHQLLYFGYAYRSVTLPQMKKSDVEAILTDLFPAKVTLLDPDEAETAIPELTAFWQFLKRQYKLSNATKILTFLKQIQPEFRDLMANTDHFGMAKSLFISGIQSGFDMTTQEGLAAFQAQHNQQIREANVPPPEFGKIMKNLQPGEPTNAIKEQLQELLTRMAGVMLFHDDQLERPTGVRPNLESASGDFNQDLQATMWEATASELPPLSKEAIALLKQQTITETTPGTIVRDFQTLLDFVGDGIAVSGTNHFISTMRVLADLNQRLSDPIELDLQRPQQKSYPPINGLYLLLRTTALGQVVGRGKQQLLTINAELLQSWNNLSPTERYFTLLEAWLIRSRPETLGDERGYIGEGTQCVQNWRSLPDEGRKFGRYADQQSLNYHPGYHNLALLKLFGMLEIKSGKPETGKGWRIQQIQKTAIGDALMQVIVPFYLNSDTAWESELNPTLPFGELQPALQPYFPEWQNNLTTLTYEARSGLFVFKVSLGKIWRRLAISSDRTLADLSDLIQESVGFDADHLDMYEYKNRVGRSVKISHPYADGSLSTDQVQVGEVPIAVGTSMLYVFDFGDWWEFDVQLEKIEADDSRQNYTAILESHGASPQQYPDWK
jgi:Plasmid pRiA4b ORF-3-like protein